MANRTPLAENEKKCPICKKLFYVYSSQWAYKDRKKGYCRYFCSYSCFRKVNKD